MRHTVDNVVKALIDDARGSTGTRMNTDRLRITTTLSAPPKQGLRAGEP
jgi:hypothetical protein